VIVFMPSAGGIPPTAQWEKIPGTLVVMAGDVREGLAALVDNYTNQESSQVTPCPAFRLRANTRRASCSTPTVGGG
jgi:hypothetical protein